MPKCPSDKIINPATGRCVKRDGALGKKILAGSKKPSVNKPKTPARKPTSKSVQRNFKIYVADPAGESIRRKYQSQLVASKWQGQMGYQGLKDIKVKMVSKTAKITVLQVTVTAEKFTSEFKSLKQVMSDMASENVGKRGYLTKQPWM